ncbi:M20/M25/M40 family metallo-hydrolase [candidate division KSB1 bacterium]
MVIFILLITITLTNAQEMVDWEIASKIRDEGLNRSKVMDYVGYMTDVIGPRLTGSPNMKSGQQWAKQIMEEIGLVNVVIEPMGEHGVSWDYEYVSIHMIEPDYQPIFGYPPAFTPGTSGKIANNAVIVDIQTTDDLEKYRGILNGAIVLTAPIMTTGPRFTVDASRRTDEELKEMSKTTVRYRGNIQQGAARQIGIRPLAEGVKRVSEEERNEFLKSEGAAVIMVPGRGGDGTVLVSGRPGSRADRSMEGVLNSLPMVTVIPEHYNRICRILEKGIPVKLEIEVKVNLDNSDTKAYNVIGEFPGSDLKDEIVIIGGHYDTWHTGTGATDNSAGCAVALEAMRILKEIGIQPRRTIKIGFWTYEEGGIKGSAGYVKRHFGNPREGTLPEYDNFSVYFNMDNGTGLFRGVYLQGNELARPVFEEWIKPFHDLGLTTLTLSNTGGTDHLSFDRAGLPGFQFIQDRIDYSTRTHHFNMDVYEKLIPEDLMVNSVIMASFAYNAAMRDELFPRKPVR